MSLNCPKTSLRISSECPKNFFSFPYGGRHRERFTREGFGMYLESFPCSSTDAEKKKHAHTHTHTLLVITRSHSVGSGRTSAEMNPTTLPELSKHLPTLNNSQKHQKMQFENSRKKRRGNCCLPPTVALNSLFID